MHQVWHTTKRHDCPNVGSEQGPEWKVIYQNLAAMLFRVPMADWEHSRSGARHTNDRTGTDGYSIPHGRTRILT